jgi:hypothetical protein
VQQVPCGSCQAAVLNAGVRARCWYIHQHLARTPAGRMTRKSSVEDTAAAAEQGLRAAVHLILGRQPAAPQRSHADAQLECCSMMAWMLLMLLRYSSTQVCECNSCVISDDSRPLFLSASHTRNHIHMHTHTHMYTHTHTHMHTQTYTNSVGLQNADQQHHAAKH